MDIFGLQKLSLLDYPGKVACTVFLGGCNLRCPYCHNSELININTAANTIQSTMTEAELIQFLESRKGLLEGVVISGGEPTIHTDLISMLYDIKKLDYPIKLDTNGNNPGMLEFLIHNHLVDYVAMDIKNGPERYSETCGVDIDIINIGCSIALLMKDEVDYEFRTTVVADFHNDDSFAEIAELISGAKRYYLQKFVDRDTVPFNLTPPTDDDLLRYKEIVQKTVKEVEIRGI